jgi:hypothetical protein
VTGENIKIRADFSKELMSQCATTTIIGAEP